MSLQQELWASLLAVPGMEEGESSWSDGPALWVNGKQIANFTGDGLLEVRLTKSVIRALKERLAADRRIEVRKSADWVRISIYSLEQRGIILELVKAAAAAHRPPAGVVPKPVPMGAAMARRKRFH
ncbi:luciferase family protein [Piscinibacter sp.]|uniref:luciferase family protein n=1 Tax=Piscinibacter sp. TaxID=1903157 RepID=UPI002BEE1D1C|nr:luciferase family protein [Albitalea sp.]HUG21592.1 luciferase family protein [Albitalea sp.]